MRRRFCLLAAVSLGLGCSALQGQPLESAGARKRVHVLKNASDFEGIRLNSAERTRCSPAVTDEFRGIAIVAPERVDLGKREVALINRGGGVPVLPVCGTIRVSPAWEYDFESLSNQILLVAVDADTHRPYVSNLLRKGFSPEMAARGPERPVEDHESASVMWFNANAFAFLQGLPEAPGRYHIFSTVGDVVSNVVDVQVVGRPSAPHSQAGPVAHPSMHSRSSTAADLTVDGHFRGIALRARADRWPASDSGVWVDGVIQLDQDKARSLSQPPVQRALVLTQSSGFSYGSFNIAGGRILFPDDEIVDDGVVRGFFSVDIGGQGVPSRDAYVLVSAGPYVSNVLRIPPPAR
jgi:hypothetical protein